MIGIHSETSSLLKKRGLVFICITASCRIYFHERVVALFPEGKEEKHYGDANNHRVG
ncbi:hypothetical protein HMPREF9374_3439 [Desmospora sp. 8437]|nr:hypothetical protein HMPREF9374_3439 [Desmospora sp. 8437]